MFFGTVFVGKAVNAQDVKAPYPTIKTTFEVVEVLNGTIATKTVDVQSSGIGSMCGISFDVGTTYVVYAGGSGAALSAGACSRTHVWKPGDADVAFAHAAAKSTATKAKVNGLVTVGDDQAQRAGIEVRVKGTQIATKTNAKGAFAFEVAPGDYELEVAGKGMRVWQGEKVALSVASPNACPKPRVKMSWDGQIQGRITYADGKPASGARVSAAGRAGTQQAWRIESPADADGRYTLHEVQAGNWNVIVSSPDEGYPSPTSPHPTTFYPGTPDKKQAKGISIKRAGLVQNIDFVVPQPATVVTITGDITRADGKPAAKAWVNVIPKGANRSTGGAADDKGVMAVQELAGLEVVVRACSAEDMKKCAEVTAKVDPAMKRLAIKLPK